MLGERGSWPHKLPRRLHRRPSRCDRPESSHPRGSLLLHRPITPTSSTPSMRSPPSYYTLVSPVLGGTHRVGGCITIQLRSAGAELISRILPHHSSYQSI